MSNKSKSLVELFNELFITTRHKYIRQYKDANGNVKYHTIPKSGEGVTTKFNDKMLKMHLRGEVTYGIFGGSQLTKFLAFDVDTQKEAKVDTLKIIEEITSYGIKREDVHVAFSGSKGYHIYLFFDDLIANEFIRMFYYRIIDNLQLDPTKIEQRPKYSIGMKLPLGVHLGTDKIAEFVDNETLEEMNAYDTLQYLRKVKRLDAKRFIEEQCEVYREVYEGQKAIKDREIENVDSVLGEIKSSKAIRDGIKGEILRVLESNQLIREGTRNNMTLFTAIYLKDLDMEQDDVKSIIQNVMKNTHKNTPELIDSSYEYTMREVERVVELVFRKGYTFTNRNQTVKLYKGEVEQLLDIKEWHLKKLYLSLLLHSKFVNRDDSVFYMSYEQMQEMGNNTKNRSRLLAYLQILVEKYGYIEIVQRSVLVSRTGGYEQLQFYEPNKYKITKKSGRDTEHITVAHSETFNFEILEKLVCQFFSRKELKEKLSRDQYKKVSSHALI